MFEAVPFPAAGDCSLRSGYYGGGTSWLLVTRASLPAGGMEIRIVLSTFFPIRRFQCRLASLKSLMFCSIILILTPILGDPSKTTFFQIFLLSGGVPPYYAKIFWAHLIFR